MPKLVINTILLLSSLKLLLVAANPDILDALNGVCPANCVGDALPAPKNGIFPYSNGCLIPEFKQGKDFSPYGYFKSCCDLHSACYMACGIEKKTCDEHFTDCMINQCKSQLDEEECTITAREFAMAQKLNGCNTFKKYQMYMCQCYDPDEAHEIVKDYAQNFFGKYNTTHNFPENVAKKYFDKKPNSKMHGDLLYRLFKRYPESIEKIASDGKTQKKVFMPQPRTSDETPNDDEEENDEL